MLRSRRGYFFFLVAVVFLAVDALAVEAFAVADLAVEALAVLFGAALVAAFVVLAGAFRALVVFVVEALVVFGAALVVLFAVLRAGAAFVAVRLVVARPVVARVRLVVLRVEVGRLAAALDAEVPREVVLPADRFVVAFGNFFAPLTTSLKVVPARKAGTLVFFTRTVSPVRGFLAVRAARARFSNTPKPVMFTFSPLLTVRMMMSTRLSTACEATFLSPKRSESASMSWALLAIPVLQEELRVTRPHRPTCAHGITNSAQIPNGARIFSLSGAS
jgi:hypothetical protein